MKKHYQASYIQDSELVQVDFLATKDEADSLYDRMKAALQDASDIQVYAPIRSEEDDVGSLSNLVDNTIHETTLRRSAGNDERFTWVKEAALAVDAAADANPGGVGVLEFIWTAAPNAYADDFRLPADRDDLLATFTSAFSQTFRDHLRSVSVTPALAVEPLPDLEAALAELDLPDTRSALTPV